MDTKVRSGDSAQASVINQRIHRNVKLLVVNTGFTSFKSPIYLFTPILIAIVHLWLMMRFNLQFYGFARTFWGVASDNRGSGDQTTTTGSN